MPNQEPGWYPDPIRQGSVDVARYWDGLSWTGQLRASTRAEKREWSEAEQAERQARVAIVREMAAEGDPEAQAIIASATSGRLDREARGAHLASWWSRVWASLIDGSIVRLLATVLSIRYIMRLVEVFQGYVSEVEAAQRTGAPLPGGERLLEQVTGPFLGIAIVYVLVALFYEVGFIAALQATPGKLALHLQVEPRAGGVVPLGQSVVRWAVKIGVSVLNAVPILGIFASIFYLVDRLWPLWDGQRQSLHDKAAGTVVVSTR